MKKLLVVFGILDIISIFTNIKLITFLISNFAAINWLQGLNLGLFIVLGFSAYFLMRQAKVGLWLTWLQFTLRLVFIVPSLGFLFELNKVFGVQDESFKILTLMLLGFEFIRLFLTSLIHKKF